jgi:hypothetical protein
MDEEMAALDNNEAWDLVKFSTGRISLATNGYLKRI